MGNLASTYQHIADILSFETSNLKLEKELMHPSFDWDAIVVEGSRHLVLPALYCRLQAKNLLHVLPKDLKTYLNEITSLNRTRNEAILSQVNSIAQLLNKHKIVHVFLKGAALLTLGCFKDNAERMIGDIDILVPDEQLDDAYQILINNHYESTEQPLGHKYFGHRHLPRLIPTHHIAAVELHNKLFLAYNFAPLSCSSIFSKKRQQAKINIPSIKHLLMHNILSFQINDNGALYKSISFRAAFDTISLLRINATDLNWNLNKYFTNYFKITGVFFKALKTKRLKTFDYSKSFYLFKLKYSQFYKIWNKCITLISLIPILFRRMLLFLSNKSYRKAIINDKKRIYVHFKSIITKN